MNTLAIDTITIGGSTYTDVKLEVTKYMTADGALALILTNTDEDGFPGLLAKVTVNLEPAYVPSEGTVFVKDYSENEGMLAFLEERGWGKATGRKELSGWVAVPEVELTGDLEKLWKAGQTA